MSGHEMRDTLARALCRHDGPLIPCWSCTVEASISVAVLADAGYLKTDDGEVRPGGFAGSASNSARAPLGREVGATPTSPSSPALCPNCASMRWVSVSLDEGWTRRAQCVPCGAIYPGTLGPGWRALEEAAQASKTDGGAGDTPPATSAVPHPAAQAGEAIGSPAPSSPRLFELYRHSDITGLTGTGVVAWGAQWPDGTASLRWGGLHPSTVAWANVERILAVHGHQGSTVIRWLDGGS